MKKRLGIIIVVAVIAIIGYLAFPMIDNKPLVAAAGKGSETYSATIYIAGQGGHFAKADITLNPSDGDNPITIKDLDRIIIGDSKTHPTHDARIDGKDRNTMFWSTIALDPNGKFHIGKTNLKTGDVIKDVALAPDPRSPGKKPPVYCASGQSEKYYMPIFMGGEGYIDVFDKKTLELKHRVFVSDLGYKAGTYKFVHGASSPDMKKFVIAINQAEQGKGNGKVDIILVDLSLLEKGQLKEIKKTTLTGEPDKTLTFRQHFSKDGKYIFQSAADRLWVLDGNTLELVDEKMTDGQLHDVMPTPNNNYAILVIRNVTEACDAEGKDIAGKTITDGRIQLYDFKAKKIVGKQVSTCQSCHKGLGLGDKTALLCGIDGNWKK